MRRGKAKSRGLSPCQTPLEEVLMVVMFTMVFARIDYRERGLVFIVGKVSSHGKV
jgi:hypothetical protein